MLERPKNSVSPPLVSVIIPLFNRAEYIAATTKSVLDQNYLNMELIIVDDGSTDGSFELVEELANLHTFKIYTHPNRENRGQSAAINLGLTKARGEFIAILDSDDLFEPNKIAIQVEALIDHPDVGLVYGTGTAIDEHDNYLYSILDESHSETNRAGSILLDCYFLLPQNSLVRKSVYEQVGGFDETLRAAQDHDMLVRMAEVTKFMFLPVPVFKYRRHANSISATGQIKRWKAGFTILEKARQRFDYPPFIIRKRKALLHFRLGMALYKDEGRLLSAAFHLFLALMLDFPRALGVLRGHERVR